MEESNKENFFEGASAFSSLNNIPTSYNDGLAKSILDMVESKDTLYVSEIIDRFGNYSTVHNQVKRLILDNKLVLYETAENSIVNNEYENQKVKKVDQSLSQWLDLAAQPCLTCSHTSECAIENPVNPASCEEFNAWLIEEIELFDDVY
ncbi:MAG: hypothetical protein INQ03_04610 [Candidatus Heimdallarchaeota archaeon]|nr:hypothetical protein [Candidatus Heimdallarchaeota archaeon]